MGSPSMGGLPLLKERCYHLFNERGVFTWELKWLQPPCLYKRGERLTKETKKVLPHLLLPHVHCLAKPCPRETLHQIHHHAVVLLESIPSISPSCLLDQEEGDVIELYVCKPPEVLLVCSADRIELHQQLHQAALK